MEFNPRNNAPLNVSIKGAFRGHEVFLQVLAYAPEDTEPGIKLDRTRRRP